MVPMARQVVDTRTVHGLCPTRTWPTGDGQGIVTGDRRSVCYTDQRLLEEWARAVCATHGSWTLRHRWSFRQLIHRHRYGGSVLREIYPEACRQLAGS